jgi:transposase-like protein
MSGKKYPLAVKSWMDNWVNLSTFFEFTAEIRKVIYTTNAIEGMHRQIRKVTKTKAGRPVPSVYLRSGVAKTGLFGRQGSFQKMDDVNP